MPALASALRNTLETTVVKARDLAERGARDALGGLAVEAKEPFGSMGDEERRLRNRLRARGRQLGDQRDAQKGTQSIERLVREMAYEHWHRMLFARFLADNQLLIEPSSGVAVSLAECEELAAEAGTDLWELAASYAQGMLPEIFRTDDPVLALRLPLEIRQQLQALVAGLDTEVFTASDSLGWTYQFWQKKRKKEVNDSGVKIGADELSPVTQLFTENYMVDFLLDNTLGAWHAGKMLAANPELARTAQTEDDLRQAVALPGCSWSYLRFVKSNDGTWAPAAGTFEGWPRTAAELKCLDPCMGSGHFVVAMFERLVALRLAEGEQLEAEAVTDVIEGNLFGLEIDPRCTQIAAFNLALAAWRRVGHCKLPAMNLACSGLAPNTREADWLAMAGDNERLRNGMERLYRLFQKASVLGSLINPRAAEGDLLVADFHELQQLLEQALAQESQDDTVHEMAVTARGVAKAAEILGSSFTLVATNVPFLRRGNQCGDLQKYIEDVFIEGRADLATAFLQRCHSFLAPNGASACVSQQHFLYLGSYKDLRVRILSRTAVRLLARLGPRAFETISGDNVTVALSCLTRSLPAKEAVIYYGDAQAAKTPSAKAEEIQRGDLARLVQNAQTKNPESRIGFSLEPSIPLLQQASSAFIGLQNGDTPRFVFSFWEAPEITFPWSPFQLTCDETKFYGGRDGILRWEQGEGELTAAPYARVQGTEAWGRKGIAVRNTVPLPVTLYCGDLYDQSSTAIIPQDSKDLPALWAFCSSEEFFPAVQLVDGKRNKTNQTYLKIPFDLASWRNVAAEKYPNGLPKPFSNDPSQWLFHGHPAGAVHPLQVAVARLLGYQWPRQTGSDFPDCPALGQDDLESLADQDGIVCLSPVRGEVAAADRLRGLLAAALGNEWSNAKERELLLETAVANDVKKAAANLGEWLRQSFFAEHCKLFQSRPFIWQVWDGNPNGFNALVNYHKLAAPNGKGRKTLELLTYTYLGRDWIDRQKQDQADGVDGADDRLAAALDLQGQLKKILEGEPPYDIFVRWKPLYQQSIGWDPDINDGVRLNIRPFLKASLRKGGRKGAGILRWKPFDIKRKADRGNEPMRPKDDFPWFWGWDETNHALEQDFGAPIPGAPPAGDSFDGNRWNDLHYSRAAKEAARAKKRGEA